MTRCIFILSFSNKETLNYFTPLWSRLIFFLYLFFFFRDSIQQTTWFRNSLEIFYLRIYYLSHILKFWYILFDSVVYNLADRHWFINYRIDFFLIIILAGNIISWIVTLSILILSGRDKKYFPSLKWNKLKNLDIRKKEKYIVVFFFFLETFIIAEHYNLI